MASRTSSSAAEGSSSAAASSSSATRLDSSLFQSYFTQAPKSILKASPADTRTQEEVAEERRRARAAARRAKERKGGVVQGRDGRPMKRLKDGRTIVRASQEGGADGSQEDDEEGETEQLARRRGDRFVGQKLGLRGGDDGDKGKAKATSSSKRNDDDPLGLGDPAFLPGGQFAHLANLTGKTSRKKTRSSASRPVTKSQQRQTATRSALPFSSARPAMAFARASK